jgi:hypothetical protein
VFIIITFWRQVTPSDPIGEPPIEATVSILARVPKGEGYRLATLEKKRGSFIKPDDALCYYLRYTDATTKKRVTVPAGEDFNATVVKALDIGNNQSAIRNGQEPSAPITTKVERLTIRDGIGQWLASFGASGKVQRQANPGGYFATGVNR